MTKDAVKWQEELAELNKLIAQVREEAEPPGYLLNAVTGAVRQILLHHDWAGARARACCGWDNVKSKASVMAVGGHGANRDMICDTCMSEVSASTTAISHDPAARPFSAVRGKSNGPRRFGALASSRMVFAF